MRTGFCIRTRPGTGREKARRRSWILGCADFATGGFKEVGRLFSFGSDKELALKWRSLATRQVQGFDAIAL